MSTILIIASVVLGCLIVGGIVFLWLMWTSASDPTSGPTGQDALDLMASDDGDGNLVFENYADESGAIYRPADGEVEVFLFMSGSYSETFKAADADEAERIYWDNKIKMQEWWINGAGEDWQDK